MNNVIRLPIAQHQVTTHAHKGWSYLLANSVAFNKDVDYGIHMQKPSQEKMPAWIEKLVTSGQCNSIYVEDLTLGENEKTHIRGLCRKHKVSLFSISVVQDKPRRVIQGPW